MKTLCIILAVALLASCTGPAINQQAAASRPASSTATSTTTRPHQQQQPDPEDVPPRIGMTKAQVLAQYGKPKTTAVTDDGERWTYVLNMGEFIGKHMIPFFFSEQGLRFGIIFFGPDGRVKKFNWDTPED